MYFSVLFSLFSVTGAIYVTPSFYGNNLQPDFAAGYLNHNEMNLFMKNLAYAYPNFTVLYTIGPSTLGKQMLVLKIRSPLLNEAVLGTPNVKYIGNIHGNEPVGRQLLLYFAEYLLSTYYINRNVKWVLDNTIIHILPSMNPDGFQNSEEGTCVRENGRKNANGVDLNRSFPDQFFENTVAEQAETIAVKEWMKTIPFVLSASFHGGAVVANYPFDNRGPGDDENLMDELIKKIRVEPNGEEFWKNLTSQGFFQTVQNFLFGPFPSLTPDDDVFKHLAKVYSYSHLTMHYGNVCGSSTPYFKDGITNGAQWYVLSGGMQDYNYVQHGCMELTLEISCCKYPEKQHLKWLWRENKQAMFNLIKEAHKGVKGVVIDSITEKIIPNAKLFIGGRNISFFTSSRGEFWRILLPGNYTLNVYAHGYEPQTINFQVVEVSLSHPSPTWVTVPLHPSMASILGHIK